MSISQEILDLKAEMIEWRHALHQNPGTKYEEFFARDLIIKKLTEWGIEFESDIAETGVVASIKGKQSKSGKSIGLRADIDALDIDEQSGQPWSSETKGKMHGCGHDGHTASLLGVAKYLNETRQFDGTVHLIFQPAEEGGRGADKMMAEGLFDRFPCDEIYAIHNWPETPLGKALVSEGPVMAAVDLFEIVINGKGGHPMSPKSLKNPLFPAAQIISGIETLSEKFSKTGELSLQPGMARSSSAAPNVVGDSFEISGTMRTFDEDIRDQVEKGLGEICKAVAENYDLQDNTKEDDQSIQFKYTRIVDVTLNDNLTTRYAAAALQDVLGAENVLEFDPVMGGEDFGSMSQVVPGAYIALGQATSDSNSPHNKALHNSGYDFNDSLLPLAVQYFVKIVEGRMPLEAQAELVPLPKLKGLNAN